MKGLEGLSFLHFQKKTETQTIPVYFFYINCDLYKFESYIRFDLYRNTLPVRYDKKGSYYEATPMTIQTLAT